MLSQRHDKTAMQETLNTFGRVLLVLRDNDSRQGSLCYVTTLRDDMTCNTQGADDVAGGSGTTCFSR